MHPPSRGHFAMQILSLPMSTTVLEPQLEEASNDEDEDKGDPQLDEVSYDEDENTGAGKGRVDQMITIS